MFLGNPSNVHEHMMLPKLYTFVLLMNGGPSMEHMDAQGAGSSMKRKMHSRERIMELLWMQITPPRWLPQVEGYVVDSIKFPSMNIPKLSIQ